MIRSVLPSQVETVAEAFTAFPGIGPKMAGKLAIYLATYGKPTAKNLVTNIQKLLDEVNVCTQCGNLAGDELCVICKDDSRDDSLLMVVENAADLAQIEGTLSFKGRYMVLGRLISPLNGVGPEDINLSLLRTYLQANKVEECIVALSSTVEGEATSIYIAELIHKTSLNTKITQLAKGMPTGVGVEYLDSDTIKGALEGRKEIDQDH